MARTTTILDHVNNLKANNLAQYQAMMIEVIKLDKLRYFTTLITFHEKDIAQINGPIMNVLKKYLGFSDEDFINNSVPELPKLEAA